MQQSGRLPRPNVTMVLPILFHKSLTIAPSPLRTKLEQKFKSSPFQGKHANGSNDKEQYKSRLVCHPVVRTNYLHYESSWKKSSSRLLSRQVVAPQHDAAAGQEHDSPHEELLLPNENIEVEKSQSISISLTDLLCVPLEHPWDDEDKKDLTLETADDSFVEHSFVASAGETSMAARDGGGICH